MKRLEMDITNCRDCPYCHKRWPRGYGETMEVYYYCMLLKGFLGVDEDTQSITPPDDCPLPDCEPSGNTG